MVQYNLPCVFVGSASADSANLEFHLWLVNFSDVGPADAEGRLELQSLDFPTDGLLHLCFSLVTTALE